MTKVISTSKSNNCLLRFDDILKNPGSESLMRVSDLTYKIQMDNACNIQFTSGVLRTVP